MEELAFESPVMPLKLPDYPYYYMKLPYNLRSRVKLFPKPPDWKPKISKKNYSRHIFSPYLHSYQMDIMFAKINRLESGRGGGNVQLYLFLININTRFLYVYAIPQKSSDVVLWALNDFIRKRPLYSITTDREKAWYNAQNVKDFFANNNIKVFYASPQYTMSTKIVDRVIKTIRDSGANLSNPQVMARIVDYYNNSIHRTIGMTPRQMQENPELEKQWIRKCIRENDIIKQHQFEAGLHSYEPGNILYLHLDDKTRALSKYMKRTRDFDRLGIFVGYEHHNVVVQLMEKEREGMFSTYVDPIIVPIYFTRFCAKDINSIPKHAFYYCY
jgi:hypothetical protein